MERKYLEVDYKEKDIVKRLGARWDPDLKKWYVPPNLDSQKFSEWEDPREFVAIAPFYLLSGLHKCWKCKIPSPVIAFASNGMLFGDEFSDEYVTYEYVTVLPPHILEVARKMRPEFHLDYSRTVQDYYLMNHCQNCEGKIGDHFIHNEHDAVFFPEDKESAHKVQVRMISEKNVRMTSEHCFGEGIDWIIEHYFSKKRR